MAKLKKTTKIQQYRRTLWKTKKYVFQYTEKRRVGSKNRDYIRDQWPQITLKWHLISSHQCKFLNVVQCNFSFRSYLGQAIARFCFFHMLYKKNEKHCLLSNHIRKNLLQIFNKYCFKKKQKQKKVHLSYMHLEAMLHNTSNNKSTSFVENSFKNPSVFARKPWWTLA